jgi:hypothetical protein
MTKVEVRIFVACEDSRLRVLGPGRVTQETPCGRGEKVGLGVDDQPPEGSSAGSAGQRRRCAFDRVAGALPEQH